ncbi:hypothetical protein BaRGS_00023178, partial [Batillaria attramentaria]
MATRSSLTVKAFLQREGVPEAEPEIRRFPVETYGPGTDLYRALVDKTVTVFPTLRPGSFCLHWKDDDDDLIQFSSLEELQHALDQSSDGVLKLYIFATDGVEEEADDAACTERETEDGTNRRVTFEVPLHAAGHPDPHHHPGHWGGPWMGRGMHWTGMGRMMGPMKKKWMKKMMKEEKRKNKQEKGKNKEFQALVRQVPEPFRRWVRVYVRTWFLVGRKEALTMTPAENEEAVPEGAPPNFRQWLSDFLSRYSEKRLSGTTQGIDVEEMEVWEMGDESGEEVEGGDLLPPPEGLPPVYYEWICRFLPRFVENNRARLVQKGFELSDEAPQCPVMQDGPFHGHGFHGHGPHGYRHWKHHGHGHGKHGCKRGKHGGHSSSDSEDNGCPHAQLWKKIPKEFRMYVRKMVKQQHKNKGGKPNEELVAPPGVTPEVNQFLQQFVQDWHAKLAEKRPRAVAMEMMAAEETTLPEGLEREHFQWLCRFMARWHRRHAGKCDVMGNWSSGDTSDDTSGDEGTDTQDADCAMYGGFGGWPRCRGNKHRFHAAMMGMIGCPGRRGCGKGQGHAAEAAKRRKSQDGAASGASNATDSDM